MNRPQQQQLFDQPAESMPWEEAAAADRLAAGVVINRPIETVFHYLVPEPLRSLIGPGRRVQVPFGGGNRSTIGFCVSVSRPPESGRKLKSIEAVIDAEPLIDEPMLELTRWIAERYLCGWGQVLESVIPGGVKRRAGTRLVQFFQLAEDAAERLGTSVLPKKQQAVFDALGNAGRPMQIDELTQAADCGTAPVSTLRKKGLIQAIRQRGDPAAADLEPIERQDDLDPTTAQRAALDMILEDIRGRRHRTLLLHGVTGSGKTEVYIQAIREVVSYGRQAIVLVPEISLTPQTIRRFRRRFDSVAVLHSHLGDAERHWHWQQIARGAVQVVVGARSAVFAPTPQLGLIVIDEEHETTFKQETTPRYHAREVARERTRQAGVPLILGSATPTLESWWRAVEHVDRLLSLPERVEGRPMPPVAVIDVRNDNRCRRGAAIGRALEAGIRTALEDDGQVILFLNLRGYSPAVWCRACGRPVRCSACDLTLTWHRDRQAVVCHGCDFQADPPARCPSCDQAGLRMIGTGTQRLEEEVRARFPGARCLRMDSDSMRRPGSHGRTLEQFRQGDAEILLGTQMIAKGLDFPRVTLVGVVDADTPLYQPDLRASERTFQLIAQVAGRTGRSERGGRVLVQTACPGEPAIRFACHHDYAGFVRGELEHRREAGVPPFSSLARIILRGPDEAATAEAASQTARALADAQDPGSPSIQILGPAPAPITRLKNLFRFHLQLAAVDPAAIRELWHAAQADLPRFRDVDLVIDVDPINLR